MSKSHEKKRLAEDASREKNWKRWGPYLSDRQWGTVREDYSHDGSVWGYFTHDQARSRAYRWGEDGLMGICDRQCRLCFAVALWNGKDPILKERLFGLTGPEGNHGEDVKEIYFYNDATPTSSYLQALYKYPQKEFPYADLVRENRNRSRLQPEYELKDTGIFNDGRYFDVSVTYAKNSPGDIVVQIDVSNRGPVTAPITILPTLWFRNYWAWGRTGEAYGEKPLLRSKSHLEIEAVHEELGTCSLVLDAAGVPATTVPIFTENETNIARLFSTPLGNPYVKDAFHEYVVNKKMNAVNPALEGTKGAWVIQKDIAPGETYTIKLRLVEQEERKSEITGSALDAVVKARKSEADEFYNDVITKDAFPDEMHVSRAAYAGLLWSKQFYYYAVKEWQEGDPTQPIPSLGRKNIRNTEWSHLYNRDIISMPDKWEYPWYAAWDLAFHMIPFAKVDPEFAKEQLILLLREWYMHPNGQIPAYEFAFSDVNPPVHAWACWRVYKMTGKKGSRDRLFLARVFQKLLLNFTWWVNRKDIGGKNLFSGGFLGLDNIGVFDRSQPLPTGGHLEQADGTAWMAFFCLTMLSMALELASEDPSYEDVASKFFEHFMSITDAMNNFSGSGLWDEVDGFYYDQLHANGKSTPLRVRSLVGIIPVLAVEILDMEIINKLPEFKKRMEWFVNHREDLVKNFSYFESLGLKDSGKRILAIPSRGRLMKILKYVLNENEFFSEHGVRSLSKIHKEHPYTFTVGETVYRVDYEPAESKTLFFGGNSNWRGPVWFPINYLLVEALERYHYYYGDSFAVECPTGTGRILNLKDVAQDLAHRLSSLFIKDAHGVRACVHDDKDFAADPYWSPYLLFHEYFHGDTGKGLGASHQTGWTSLITRCIEKQVLARNKAHDEALTDKE